MRGSCCRERMFSWPPHAVLWCSKSVFFCLRFFCRKSRLFTLHAAFFILHLKHPTTQPQLNHHPRHHCITTEPPLEAPVNHHSTTTQPPVNHHLIPAIIETFL